MGGWTGGGGGGGGGVGVGVDCRLQRNAFYKRSQERSKPLIALKCCETVQHSLLTECTTAMFETPLLLAGL